MDIAITKMSSKGQIVIPQDMRKDLPEGEKLAIIKIGKQLLVKKVKDLDKNFEDDIRFAQKTEEAWEAIDRGEGITMTEEEFFKALQKW